MPYEEVKKDDLEAAREVIAQDLTPEEQMIAEAVCSKISEEVKTRGFCNQARGILELLTNNQLRYIIVHSECYNIQYSCILEIFDKQARLDPDFEKMTKPGLIETAVFVATTEPDKMSRATF